MTHEQVLSFDRLSERVEQQQKKALFRIVILSIVTIGIAGLFLFFTLRQIEYAQQQLDTVNSQISEANAKRQQAQALLKTTQDNLQAAEMRADTLLQQVKSLEGQLANSQKALADSQKKLADALNFERYVYHLSWGDLKEMYVMYGDGANVLAVIDQLKSQVRWDRANNPAQSAYNSPGFATLVLQRLNRLPANGTLAALPHDTGRPKVGDIVVYEAGYNLFYFRDRSDKEFVVGMTPFGVTALNYDFGSKITGVIRTGLLTR